MCAILIVLWKNSDIIILLHKRQFNIYNTKARLIKFGKKMLLR